jgi:hypothetical protein
MENKKYQEAKRELDAYFEARRQTMDSIQRNLDVINRRVKVCLWIAGAWLALSIISLIGGIL